MIDVRIRIYPKDDGTILPVAEVATRNGKRATTGDAVKPDDLRKEVRRLIAGLRGEEAELFAMDVQDRS